MGRTEQLEIDVELAEAQRDFAVVQEDVARGRASLRDLGVATAQFADRRRALAQRQRSLDMALAEQSRAFPQRWIDERLQMFADAMAEGDKLNADAQTLGSGRVPRDLPRPKELLMRARELRAAADERVRKARRI